jgi:hypothetical protein
VALDVNFIDTADSYAPEVIERLIAEALYPYPENCTECEAPGTVSEIRYAKTAVTVSRTIVSAVGWVRWRTRVSARAPAAPRPARWHLSAWPDVCG